MNNVLKIYELIKNNQFNEAKIIVDKLYSKINIHYTYKVDYLKGIINEKEKDYLIKDTKEGLEKQKYILLGNQSYEEKNYEQAIEHYQEGFSKTKEPIFLYNLGLCYYELKDYNNSLNKFELYKNRGFEMLDMTYYFLAEIHAVRALMEKQKKEEEGSNFYNKKYSRLLDKSDSYMSKYYTYNNIKNGDLYHNNKKEKKIKPTEIITSDEEVENLIKNGKLNDVIAIYEETDYSRKITILALLYMNGFEKLADKTYKKDKDILNKECSSLVKQLNKNKTLYKMKRK